jgi:hypothetical protein
LSRSGTQSPPKKQKQLQKQKQAQQIQKQKNRQAQIVAPPSDGNAHLATAQAADAKRDARMQRQAEARAAAQRRRRAANIRKIGIAGAAVLVIAVAVVTFIIQEANKPGQSVSIMADRHHLGSLTEGHVPYSTTPPTSGPHVSTVPLWQVYADHQPDELMVHGLEDGGVIINYRPDDLDKAQVDKLAAVAQTYEQLTDSKNHVLMQPYPNISNAIVLTSWGRMDKMDTFDETRIRRFIEAYAGWDHHEGKEGQRIAP